MSSAFQKFKSLHSGKEIFLLPNVWDARSAIMFQESGYPAVGTSSAAVANSLGLEDGENMSFEDYLFVIRKIVAAVKIPLTVDVEMGYGSSDEAIAKNVCALAEIGVAGINIEDSFVDNGSRKLKDPVVFSKTIEAIKSALKSRGLDLFVNLRCDTHILNVPGKQSDTIERLKIYDDSRADGIFIPCIDDETQIADVVKNTKLPLNVMCIPTIPDIDRLTSLGVKRVSMGPFAFHKVYKEIGELSRSINSSRSFKPLFTNLATND